MFNAFQLRQFADILEATARGLRDVADHPEGLPAQAAKPAEPQTPLRECDLSIRSKKVCMRLGIETVEQLAAKTEREITRVKGCGVSGLNELREALRQHGKVFAESMI
jgi:DNA-directed RNA polymerase alpha subunit